MIDINDENDLKKGEAYTFIVQKRSIFSDESDLQMKRQMKSNSLELIIDEDVDVDQDHESSRPINIRKDPNGCTIIVHDAKFEKRSSFYFKCQSPQDEINLEEPDDESLKNKMNKGLNDTWQKNGFRIITLVVRFLHQLKTKANKLKIKLMTNHIFQYIGDASSNYKQFKLNRTKQNQTAQRLFKLTKVFSFFKVIKKILNLAFSRIQVFSPESTFKLVWDSIVVCFIVINIFYIPMSLSFDLDKSDTSVTLFFETIPSYVFIAEILLNFNTAYYKHGLVHTDRMEIFKNYVGGSFGWDLMIAIPFILAQFNIPYIQFVLLLRVTRVRSMIQNVEDLLNVKESVQTILELSKLVYFIVFVVHVCSCAWHLLGKIEIETYNQQDSWLMHYGHYYTPWYERYLVSIYWSVITTLTVGYGDIVPQTVIERVFVIFVAMIICGVFGYTISTIGQILQNFGLKEKEFKREMKEINQYIKDKQLNFQLSLKVRKYFEYQIQLQQKQSKNTLDQKIMRGLNDQLKTEVMIDIYRKILMKSQLLKKLNNNNNNILNLLCQKVSQQSYAPGDDIIISDTSPDKLLFIIDGKVSSYTKNLSKTSKNITNQGKFIKNHTNGTIFGEMEFILQVPHQQSVKALTFTQVAYIEYESFIEIIRQDFHQYLAFKETIDKLLYQKKSGTCDICKWTHNYLDCPFVFYQINKLKIIKNRKKEDDIPNLRMVNYAREKTSKTKTKLEYQQNLESCIEFLISGGQLQEKYVICIISQLNDSFLEKLGVKSKQQQKQEQYEQQQSQSQQQQQQSHLFQQFQQQSFDDSSESQKSPDLMSMKRKRSSLLNSVDFRKSFNDGILKPFRMPLNQISQMIKEEETQKPHTRTIARGITRKLCKENSELMEKLDTPRMSEIIEAESQRHFQNEQISFDIDNEQSYDNYFPQFNLQTVLQNIAFQQLRELPMKKKKSAFQTKIRNLRVQRSTNKLNSINSLDQPNQQQK